VAALIKPAFGIDRARHTLAGDRSSPRSRLSVSNA
jgi:hypothetical protein